MAKTIELQRGTSMQARGRNGWFEPREVRVAPFGRNLDHGDDKVLIHVNSRRAGGTPPIWLELAPTDAAMLGQALIQESQGITQNESADGS